MPTYSIKTRYYSSEYFRCALVWYFKSSITSIDSTHEFHPHYKTGENDFVHSGLPIILCFFCFVWYIKKSCWDTRDRRASVIVLFFVIWLTANYLVISACCMVTTLLISFCDWLLLDGIKTNAYCFVSATKNSGQLVELWAWLRSTLIPLVTVLTFSLSRILTPCI